MRMPMSGRCLLLGRVLTSGSASGFAVTSGLGSSAAIDCLASLAKGEAG